MPVPTIVRNVVISPAAGSLQTSTVGEPSVSANGPEVLFTGNWYAAYSKNSGATWAPINPYTFFPSASNGFCCDQTLIYIPKIKMHVWLLQYDQLNGTNVLRIAFKDKDLGTRAGWKWWDLVPGNIDAAWANDWFDYNHAAYSDAFLYVGTNMFRGNNFMRGVIFRIPFTAFQPGAQLTLEKFVSGPANFSLRCVQGATSTMYFASHEGGTGRQLRIFAWPNNQSTVTSALVSITPWNQGWPYGPVGPGGSNWIGRCDGRITGGWLANGTLGFMWTANKQGTGRPFPYIRVVRINASTLTRIDEPDIWNATTAFGYSDACPNDQGDVGVTLFAGGKTHPIHYVGMRSSAGSTWDLAATAASTHSPTQPKWGDYLTCRRQNPASREWVASCYRLNGGGGISNIEPHFIHFK